jgi:hypothetical protein
VEEAVTATSKSAVSRRFVAAIETALAELMSKRLVTWTWWRSWSTRCTPAQSL